jgi:hypothetical protein
MELEKSSRCEAAATIPTDQISSKIPNGIGIHTQLLELAILTADHDRSRSFKKPRTIVRHLSVDHTPSRRRQTAETGRYIRESFAAFLRPYVPTTNWSRSMTMNAAEMDNLARATIKECVKAEEVRQLVQENLAAVLTELG